MFPISFQVHVRCMCHLYLLYSARSLGLSNQFHKDTRLISAAAHIMSRALLLSSAELPARGHEQINRDVTQVPALTCPPVNTKVGKGRCEGGTKKKTPSNAKGCDPCKVPLVTADLQNFIMAASCVGLIIWKVAVLFSLESALCAYIYDLFVRGAGVRYEGRRHPLSDYLQALFADLYRPTTTPSIIRRGCVLLALPGVPLLCCRPNINES